MPITQLPKAKTCFQLKGSMHTFTTLKLIYNDHSQFCKQLYDKIQTSPKFFEHAPIILDVSLLQDDLADNLASYSSTMQQSGLSLIAIKTNSPVIKEKAQQLNIATLKSSTTDLNDTNPITTSTSTEKSKIIRHPVRSGQQIYAKGADLIILNSVSAGAEILADGNIHVYGALRGRALAGVQGDIEAMIFCLHFDAELISIAGHYLVADALQPHKQNQSVKISLYNQQLQINAL